MFKPDNAKLYDLEERTFAFARDVRDFSRKITLKSVDTHEYLKQLIRSSASVAANYIEANCALSKKDFVLRIKISRKEAKESLLWLRLIEIQDMPIAEEQKMLQRESLELVKILSTIIIKCQGG